MEFRRPQVGISIFFAIAFLWGHSAHSLHPHCTVDVNDPSVPECPESGMLDDSYPASVILLGNEGNSSFATVLSAFSKIVSTEKTPPLILINTSPENHARLLKYIKENVKPEEQSKWINSFHITNSAPYSWNQDFFQSYVDPKTGRPFLREVLPYRRSYHKGPNGDKVPSAGPEVFKAVSQILKEQCDIPTSKGMDVAGNQDVYGGYAGGNIEAAPGNICMLGDNGMPESIHNAYMKAVCPPSSTPLKVPTYWLSVGHVDEIVTTVRTSEAAPCNFRMLVARPSKALEVLRANPQGKALKSLVGLPDSEIASYIIGTRKFSNICAAYLQKRKDSPPLYKPEDNGTKTQSRLLWWPVAHASEDKPTIQDCIHMSNGELLSILEEDPSLNDYNSAVDGVMKKFQNDLEQKLAEKFPNCKNRVSSVPALFQGTTAKQNGKSVPGEPWEAGGGTALYPNIVNSVQLKDAYYVSDPINEGFQNEIKGQMSAVDVTTHFVNTRSLHTKQGNLHCASNTVRYCRPKKRGPQ